MLHSMIIISLPPFFLFFPCFSSCPSPSPTCPFFSILTSPYLSCACPSSSLLVTSSPSPSSPLFHRWSHSPSARTSHYLCSSIQRVVVTRVTSSCKSSSGCLILAKFSIWPRMNPNLGEKWRNSRSFSVKFYSQMTQVWVWLQQSSDFEIQRSRFWIVKFVHCIHLTIET